MERSKLELDQVEEALGHQIDSNTELKGCTKVKSEEFEIGDEKFRFFRKTDVCCKMILLAPLVMARPKLELVIVQKALGYQIRLNKELVECWKNKSEEFEIEREKFSAFVKI